MPKKKSLEEEFQEIYRQPNGEYIFDEDVDYFDKYIDFLEARVNRLQEALLCAENISMLQEEIPEELKTSQEKSMQKALNKIYRITHVAPKPSCFDNHQDWEKEFQEYIEMINDIG